MAKKNTKSKAKKSKSKAKKSKSRRKKRKAEWEKLDHKDFDNYEDYIRARNRLKPDYRSRVGSHLVSLKLTGCDIVVTPKGRVVINTHLTEEDVDPGVITRKIKSRQADSSNQSGSKKKKRK